MSGMVQDSKQRKITGSVQVRRGTWHTVLNLYEDGKRKQKWTDTGLPERGNKRKAEKIKALHIEQEESRLAESQVCTTYFSDFALVWLNGKLCKERSTWENYENIVKNHLIPYFKKRLLNEIEPKDIRAYYVLKQRNGRVDGKGGLAHETLKKHSSVLFMIFEEGYELEEIKNNPAERVKIPEPSVEEKKDKLEDAVFLTIDEANRMLSCFEDDILQPLLKVTLYFGLRRSEVLGLKRDAIDFEEHTLDVKHTVVKHKTIVKKDRMKSRASKGVYSLNEEIEELLRQVLNEKEKNRELFGEDYEENDYLFTWPDGHEYYPDYVSKRFKTVIQQNGFHDKMTFHDLRHSCASILYEKGWNVKDIQEWLRHSKLQTTMDIYTHISNERKKILAKDMEGTFRQCKVSGLNDKQHPGKRRRQTVKKKNAQNQGGKTKAVQNC